MARGKGREITIDSAKPKSGKSAFSRETSAERNADYGRIDPVIIRDAIEAVTALGGAIRFGYTRDGGAYAVGVYRDGDSHTEYCRSDDDLDDYVQFLQGLGTDQSD